MKIIIDGKKTVFLFLIIIMILLFCNVYAENNARMFIKDILTNGISVDNNHNDKIDKVDFSHRILFTGIVGEFGCKNKMMIGVNENGAICKDLNTLFNEYNQYGNCNRGSKSGSKIFCDATREEMTYFGPGQIVCCGLKK